ncbi:DUF5684 domain-containing protein [Pseudanabaena sp. ABRG5-3]|uniref:DUF5684 domain-containing protein n=1 Tax=Pseudanabaena sp. ABRG5-3 TaxID=685565 RepID=UPI000DC71AEF|nr:DUF5684 domain-containing protein [Pseudanabaena sp. ABRG5-3]BBC25455.1 hypothetical protein ABRG53_3198 [Pseudanabaena sp. ABRG5-3]
MNLSKYLPLQYLRVTWRRVALFLITLLAVVSLQHLIAAPSPAASSLPNNSTSSAIAVASVQNGDQLIAQSSDPTTVNYDSLTEEQKALADKILLFAGTFGLVAYLFTSFCLMKIADKLDIPNSWLSWVPIAQIWVMVRAAGKPGWWLILFFIPLVNFVIGLIVFFSIPTSLNKSSLYGLLIFVPILGVFLYFGLLAFT